MIGFIRRLFGFKPKQVDRVEEIRKLIEEHGVKIRYGINTWYWQLHENPALQMQSVSITSLIKEATGLSVGEVQRRKWRVIVVEVVDE